MSMDRGASPQTALCAILLLVASFGLMWSPVVSAQAETYCYATKCYANLSEAEAAMKAASSYGNMLRPNGRSALGPNRQYYLYYTVNNQEPTRFWTTYAIPSVDSNMACSAGNPLRPNSCGTEEEAMGLYWNGSSVYKPTQCVLGAPAVAGEYVSPYRYSTEVPIAGRSYGEFRSQTLTGGVYVSPSDTFRRMEYSVVCPGVTPRVMGYSLDKSVVYECPIGFKATAVDVNAAKPPIYGTKWCRPTGEMPVITVKLRQYESCPANPNPCFPGTGDKMRIEPDFEVSGWTFARVYHSLAELDAGGLSAGWSTTFTERVITSTTPALVTEAGFYESLVSMGGSRYRSSVHPDRILEVLGSPVSGYRAIRGSEIKDFDAAGRLIKLRDANNAARTLELLYTGALLTDLRTAQGRTTNLAYEANRLSSVTLSGGAVIDYGYDARGNLTTVRQAGATRTYIYGEPDKTSSSKPHLLTGIVDESGQRYTSFYYDSDGRVTGSHLHGGQGPVEATTVQYSGADSVYVSTDGGGSRTITYASGDYRMPVSIVDQSGTRSNTYASALLTKSIDQKGVVTTYEYYGFLSAVEAAANSPERRKISYSRDELGRITKQDVSALVSGAMRVVSSERRAYSASGAQVAFCQVDPNNGLATAYTCGSQQIPPQGVRQTSTAYCSQDDVNLGVCPIVGLVTSVDGPRTDVRDVTTYHYYMADHPDCTAASAACLWRRGDLWKVTGATGHVTETLRYDGQGRVLSTRDGNGVITELEYDHLGRLTIRRVSDAH